MTRVIPIFGTQHPLGVGQGLLEQVDIVVAPRCD
jgi:hypothetical protein